MRYGQKGVEYVVLVVYACLRLADSDHYACLWEYDVEASPEKD